MRDDKEIFRRVEKELPINDPQKAFRDLSKYISNKKGLQLAVKSNTINFEYNFWLSMHSEQWFMDGLDQLLDCFHQAKAMDESKCFQAYIDIYPKIDRGLKNSQQLFHLEGDKSIERLDLFGKVCFREIGDMIEGSLKPFMQFALLMSYIADGKNKTGMEIQEMSLGGIVNEFLKTNKFTEIYQPSPWKVPINQWRNIAQHFSFKVDATNLNLECEYGTTNKKTIKIDRDSLIDLMIKIHAICYLHKIAHLFFFIDNMDDLSGKFSATSFDISEDSIKSHVLSAIISNKFKLLSLKREQDWDMELLDPIKRRPEARYTALNNIAAAFRLLIRDRNLNLTVHYWDRKGKQTLKAIVK